MSEKNFLVEIGTEELPPKALRSGGIFCCELYRGSWITLASLTATSVVRCSAPSGAESR